LLLRADDEPAGCLGVHHTAEITRMYVTPRFRRALYVSYGFTEIAPATETPGPFQDHWYEKLLDP
jgi:hypothetical protein